MWNRFKPAVGNQKSKSKSRHLFWNTTLCDLLSLKFQKLRNTCITSTFSFAVLNEAIMLLIKKPGARRVKSKENTDATSREHYNHGKKTKKLPCNMCKVIKRSICQNMESKYGELSFRRQLSETADRYGCQLDTGKACKMGTATGMQLQKLKQIGSRPLDNMQSSKEASRDEQKPTDAMQCYYDQGDHSFSSATRTFNALELKSTWFQ